jgi:hypothetical protein
MDDTIEVVDPLGDRATGEHAQPAGGPAPRVRPATLHGCTVGFIDNAKPNFALLVDDLAQRLVDAHGVARIVRHQKPNASIGASPQVIGEIGGECDVVIAGSGD